MSEILSIAMSSSFATRFCEKTSALITKMENQGRDRSQLIKSFLKACKNHQLVFKKYDIPKRNL